MSDLDTVVNTRVKKKLSEPKKWRVIMLNDNTTTMEFVLLILTTIFKHTENAAQESMLRIHSTGSDVVGVYNFDIAEAKALEATVLARNNSYPLQIKVESE
jgi:ATP-dependent Clp protease adaptor protein ClpS